MKLSGINLQGIKRKLTGPPQAKIDRAASIVGALNLQKSYLSAQNNEALLIDNFKLIRKTDKALRKNINFLQPNASEKYDVLKNAQKSSLLGKLEKLIGRPLKKLRTWLEPKSSVKPVRTKQEARDLGLSKLKTKLEPKDTEQQMKKLNDWGRKHFFG